MDISDLNFKPCQCEYQVPNTLFSAVSSPFYLLNALSRYRFADFAGITFEGTSTISALPVGGITLTKLAN